MIVTVCLPWPPAVLWSNRKRSAHWSDYRGPAKEYRKLCWAIALQALGRFRFAEPPQVRIEFHQPDLRFRDDDNMINAFKHGRDGIADAVGHDDRTWRPAYSFDHQPHRPDGKVVVILSDRKD